MPGQKARIARVAALHRQATATVDAAAAALDAIRPAPADRHRQRDLAARLRAAAQLLAPGWAGADWNFLTAALLDGEEPALPPYVRIGTAAPLDDARFPALVPLLGTGHLHIDGGVGDPRVTGLLRAVLLRLLAAAPPGTLLVRAVCGPAAPELFAGFAPLAAAGVLPPAATDVTGLRAMLAEAEQWAGPADAPRRPRHDRTLLLTLAGLPEGTGEAELARLTELARGGPAANLHLLLAGWPAPGVAPELPLTTTVEIRNPYALVGDPPATRYGAPPAGNAPGGLNAPVFVDAAPPDALVERVCRRLAHLVDAGNRPGLTELLPDQFWRESSADGLSTCVGDAAGRPVVLGFGDVTPHWLVGGRSGAGKTAFLANVLFGLAARYGPDQLSIQLVDLGPGEAFAEYLQTEGDRSWLPHVRAAGMEADREYLLAVLDDLEAELQRRVAACAEFGVTRFAQLRAHSELPRLLVVIENFPLLLAPADRLSAVAVERLAGLAQRCRMYGIHLVLAGNGPMAGGAGPRDPLLGQFPVRVALPGGAMVLEPANDAAAGLPLGSAVVNTAGGLGGPRRATRGHERTIRFPDPTPQALGRLRERLWRGRAEGFGPPSVFAGYSRPALANDPGYRGAVAGGGTTASAFLGRAVDVARSSVSFEFGAEAGRHLAVVGAGEPAVELLVTAVRTVAAQHEPGSARFLLLPLIPAATARAEQLAAVLARHHPARIVAQDALRGPFDGDHPTYLVVLGMDALGGPEIPTEMLRELLRDGPAKGVHLLCWWRQIRPLALRLGAAIGAGELAGLVTLDVPELQLTALVRRPVQWRARPDRAYLHDLHRGTATVLVPYAAGEVG